MKMAGFVNYRATLAVVRVQYIIFQDHSQTLWK